MCANVLCKTTLVVTPAPSWLRFKVQCSEIDYEVISRFEDVKVILCNERQWPKCVRLSNPTKESYLMTSQAKFNPVTMKVCS